MSSLRKNRNKISSSSLSKSSLLILILLLLINLIYCQCPWPRTPIHVSLHSDCVCGYSNVRRLSVQCSPMANFSQLLDVLNSPSVQRLPIDLLYINNATGLKILPKNAFKKLDIQQIHLANTFIEKIDKDAFSGLEHKLNSLTLQNVGLKEIPSTIKTLKSLKTLDLSNNRIKKIRSRAFEELNQLSTLRLAFNNDLNLETESFYGLDRTLKNLNIKGINLKHIPDAILNLTELAFLDLAQNKIEEIKPRMFRNHHLLTALSLERNLIRSIHPDTFVGLNDSLSSLSLLNNILIEFPLLALSKLTGLRVLDLGFNAIRQLPEQAFRSNELLTLLALDGNPLKTLSLQTFKHLNNSLRGLSVGGKFFECDCKVRWLAEWAREYSLQITSRERNPQFCSKPPHLRKKLFTHIDLDDFVCPPLMSTSTKSPITIIPKTTSSPILSTTMKKTLSSSTITTTTTTTTTTMKPSTLSTTIMTTTLLPNRSTESNNNNATGYVKIVPIINEENEDKIEIPTIKTTTTMTTSTSRSTNNNNNQLIDQTTLKLLDANYRNGSIYLRWEILRQSKSGYQILYRYFGSKEFFYSELLSPKINNYILDKNIKSNELIIVCIINLDINDYHLINYDDINISRNIIPNEQCRELNTREIVVKKSTSTLRTPSIISSSTTTTATSSTKTTLSSLYPTLKRLNDIDKIVIGISAAVCLFIIIVVLIFSCCFYRSSSKDSPLQQLTTNATCLSTKSLLSASFTLPRSTYHDPEWETVSVYSTKSIPRARITQNSSLSPPIGPTTLYHTTDTLRSYNNIKHHHHHHTNNQQNGYIHPVSRYIGSAMPTPPPPLSISTQKSINFQSNPWLDNYYPSMQAISYGTLVTANGGGPYNNAYNLDTYNNNNLIDRKKINHKLGKNRQQIQHQPQRQQIYSKSYVDLRSSNGTDSNGSSSNRLLLSSTSTTSNSYQSQNDYDSDHHQHQQQHHRILSPALKNSSSMSPTSSIATTNLSNSNNNNNPMMMMNNDNEVDIYIDQNYAKRFF